jgi:two-component system, LytTR family, response regulator
MILGQDYDVVFLDIQMPGISGFDVIDAIGVDAMPSIVFTTAFEEYALKAFDAMAVDYLLKPFTLDRFRKALHRATDQAHKAPDEAARLKQLLEQMLAKIQLVPRAEKLVVRGTDKIHFIEPSTIKAIEADGHYIRIQTISQSYYERKSLKEIEDMLDPRDFCRIHRSTIVNRAYIREMQPLTHGDYCVILQDNSRFTMSRRYSSLMGI